VKFADIRRAGWDTETTGPDPTAARIVTAAFIARGGGRPDRTQTWLINPGVPIPAETTAVHGITTEQAQADGADPATALDEIATRIVDAIGWGMPVVAFNHSFDWSVLHYDLQRHGLPTVAERLDGDPVTLIDPHVIDKQYDRYVKGAKQRKLKPTAGRYDVELTDWHTAEADAMAALLIAEKQFERYPRLNEYSPAELFEAQRKWRAEQQADLQTWFRTKASMEQGGDRNKVIDGSWPLVPPRAEKAGA
jgi:DNA polymerase III subunit epsilon